MKPRREFAHRVEVWMCPDPDCLSVHITLMRGDNTIICEATLGDELVGYIIDVQREIAESKMVKN